MAGNPHIEFAGDFSLENITIHNHEDNLAVDIKGLVVEFNIYESIFANALTGSLVISDSTGLIGKLPVQGTERLTFKLSTKGMPVIDCSDETGHPMHIYKLSDKQQAKDGMQVYVLHFCSREFLRNLRTKVSKAFSGTLDQMVNSIMTDKEFIDTRGVDCPAAAVADDRYGRHGNAVRRISPDTSKFGAAHVGPDGGRSKAGCGETCTSSGVERDKRATRTAAGCRAARISSPPRGPAPPTLRFGGAPPARCRIYRSASVRQL